MDIGRLISCLSFPCNFLVYNLASIPCSRSINKKCRLEKNKWPVRKILRRNPKWLQKAFIFILGRSIERCANLNGEMKLSFTDSEKYSSLGYIYKDKKYLRFNKKLDKNE